MTKKEVFLLERTHMFNMSLSALMKSAHFTLTVIHMHLRWLWRHWPSAGRWHGGGWARAARCWPPPAGCRFPDWSPAAGTGDPTPGCPPSLPSRTAAPLSLSPAQATDTPHHVKSSGSEANLGGSNRALASQSSNSEPNLLIRQGLLLKTCLNRHVREIQCLDLNIYVL